MKALGSQQLSRHITSGPRLQRCAQPSTASCSRPSFTDYHHPSESKYFLALFGTVPSASKVGERKATSALEGLSPAHKHVQLFGYSWSRLLQNSRCSNTRRTTPEFPAPTMPGFTGWVWVVGIPSIARWLPPANFWGRFESWLSASLARSRRCCSVRYLCDCTVDCRAGTRQ